MRAKLPEAEESGDYGTRVRTKWRLMVNPEHVLFKCRPKEEGLKTVPWSLAVAAGEWRTPDQPWCSRSARPGALEAPALVPGEEVWAENRTVGEP